MMGDLRLALRTLRRTPAYTLTVVLTLALGIGGAAAVYSVLRSVIHPAAGDRPTLGEPCARA